MADEALKLVWKKKKKEEEEEEGLQRPESLLVAWELEVWALGIIEDICGFEEGGTYGTMAYGYIKRRDRASEGRFLLVMFL